MELYQNEVWMRCVNSRNGDRKLPLEIDNSLYFSQCTHSLHTYIEVLYLKQA